MVTTAEPLAWGGWHAQLNCGKLRHRLRTLSGRATFQLVVKLFGGGSPADHNGRVCFTVRRADAADAEFLAEMLAEAAFWRPDDAGGRVEEVLRQPQLAHYVVGWPRFGDLGVVALNEQVPVGAAWVRLLPEGDPGYGFVNAATPELAMGVVQEWRGHGIGSRLLDALIAAAREQGLASLSLSVEPDNHALRLYERAGFKEVAKVDESLTMLLHLQHPSRA